MFIYNQATLLTVKQISAHDKTFELQYVLPIKCTQVSVAQNLRGWQNHACAMLRPMALENADARHCLDDQGPESGKSKGPKIELNTTGKKIIEMIPDDIFIYA